MCLLNWAPDGEVEESGVGHRVDERLERHQLEHDPHVRQRERHLAPRRAQEVQGHRQLKLKQSNTQIGM